MGQRKIVALSGSSKETAAYGKFLGKRLRFITNRDTMKSEGFGVTEVHYLPGWNKRRDRHAIAAVVNNLRRQRRSAPLIERHIIRLQDGQFVDQDYRGPELEAVASTQEAQIDGLRQMHVHDQAITPPLSPEEHAEITGDEPDFYLDDVKPIVFDVHQEADGTESLTADQAAEENGMELEEFFDFLDGDEKT